MGLLIGRRPLRHVAMLGGTGFAAGVAKARRAQMQAARVARRAGPEPAAQAPPAAPGADLVASLRELKALQDEGVLSAAEFEAAKRKLLAG